MQTATRTYTFGSRHYDLTSRTHVMGILNVTPDSFSDGGRFFKPEQAVRHGMEMAEQGADFIDVGGESTRPGSEPLPVDEELRRVLPVIERLAKSVEVPISIDTYKSEVATRALNAGAVLVNDISGLHFDPRVADVAAAAKASLVLMHIKGTPRTMQLHPEYDDLVGEISTYLEEGVRIARGKGIDQIIVDPGIGFGKTLEHNLELLRRLEEFQHLGCPVLVGPSRKSFIGKLLGGLPAEERLEGTIAAVTLAVAHGANIVRVHDVQAMKRVVTVADAIARA
jgi:dihydropteroate synthase